jgi:hypothetical protein
MAFETRERRAARKAREQARYVELEVSTLEEMAKVDRYSRRDGEPVSSFGRALEDAFVRLGVPPEEVLGRPVASSGGGWE